MCSLQSYSLSRIKGNSLIEYKGRFAKRIGSRGNFNKQIYPSLLLSSMSSIANPVSLVIDIMKEWEKKFTRIVH